MAPVATTTSVERPPLSLAGFPVSSWAFAVRIWLAMILALYASFWLELDSTSAAATTVAILALPTRGQGFEKAEFRLLGTIVGTMAAIVITGALSQTGSLLLAGFAVWVGLCVYVAYLLDGGRAYAAVLCCVTVALAAMENIDSPQLVFSAGMARAASMSVGVLAIGLVSDLFAAPDYHPVLRSRLSALQDRVMGYADTPEGSASASAGAMLLRDIVALRPEITSLTTESSSGTARRAAAQSAMLSLVAATSIVRMIASLPPALSTAAEEELLDICRAWLMQKLAEQQKHISADLEAIRTATMPFSRRRAPIYRSRRIAAENGLRAAASFFLIAALLAAAGWPSTQLCLAIVALFIALSATVPNPAVLAKVSVLAIPLSCLLAGVLKFMVLSGLSDFELLAIALAPIVIGLALIISEPNGIRPVLARLTLVFTLLLFTPTNPETYDPQTFLTTCLLAVLGSILFLAAQLVIPPLSGDRRVKILLAEIRRKPRALHARRAANLDYAEELFCDASRVEQIVTAGAASSSAGAAIEEAVKAFDRAAAVRQSCAELQRLTMPPLVIAAAMARTALSGRDGRAVLRAAATMRETAKRHNVSADSACASLVATACVFQLSPND